MNEEKLNKKAVPPFPSEEEIKQQLSTLKPEQNQERQILLKMLVGWQVANRVENNQLIGLGSGTTAAEAVKAIGERLRLKEIANIKGISTSDAISQLAQSLGIDLLLENFEGGLDWGFDGADEVEWGSLNLIKGGGGAATAEKRLSKRCKEWIVIVDETKMVDELGAFPVAIEVKNEVTLEEMQQTFIDHFGGQSVQAHHLKEKADTGGRLFEIQFVLGTIQTEWEQVWPKQFSWLIESGLFMDGYPNEVWVAHSNGEIEVITGPGKRNT